MPERFLATTNGICASQLPGAVLLYVAPLSGLVGEAMVV